MNGCLGFAWLGDVGIGGTTHKGRREKNARGARPGLISERSKLSNDVASCGDYCSIREDAMQ